MPFDKFECERLMEMVVNEAMHGFQFEAEEAEEMSKKLSKEILQKMKNLTYDRLVFLLNFFTLLRFVVEINFIFSNS